ncbi:cytochrome c3 family protein [Sunxiuqinia indica]|uniref:cytochrome c3 family protein n=1 Tax=Sunxiuqinia indica TaxID=2692584 RepID=UPI00135CC68F|nr:cytochrome c3 family protein [Sunxiuqinia indica]
MLFVIPACVKEGPPGLDGADGADGVAGADGADGEVACLVCHSTEVKEDNEREYFRSQHASGALSLDYAGGRDGCAECHSGNGFVEWVETGDVTANITPEAINCNTCHDIHSTFAVEDYALRITTPVDVIGVTVDLGNSSNLCVNCHKPRRGWEDYDDGSLADSVMVTSTHAGPHHGPQTAVLMGLGGDHRIGSIDASAIGPSTHGTDVEDATCVGCHMYESTDESEGGHTWWPAVESCKVCHATATDFDYKGGQTKIDLLMAQLAELLEAQEGQKIAESAPRAGDWHVVPGTVHGIIHFDEEDKAYHPVIGQFDRDVFSAFWNFMTILEDRSHGVHNPAYAEALLLNAIEILD